MSALAGAVDYLKAHGAEGGLTPRRDGCGPLLAMNAVADRRECSRRSLDIVNVPLYLGGIYRSFLHSSTHLLVTHLLTHCPLLAFFILTVDELISA